jgi:hypothetical protein
MTTSQLMKNHNSKCVIRRLLQYTEQGVIEWHIRRQNYHLKHNIVLATGQIFSSLDSEGSMIPTAQAPWRKITENRRCRKERQKQGGEKERRGEQVRNTHHVPDVKFYGLATHADGTFVEFHPYSDLVHILEYIVSELQRQARLANTCDNQSA